ncbi:hypothetical protein BDK51DRAFT_39810 [Blyttiomyces helicus]|uniref:Uncharacterized protein n=1 Tax=Blyttiomyces helicus TaxID=388810 RepID=A0A4P9W8C0_9FUNG|nr:hypothetical protein BDK51DRAFT_39810 [Blyttiomyces helicus]|eukprot:RKO88771.1 hypothetical protein BDK51DRAFT_39810 [Blyttiomyces helicus]
MTSSVVSAYLALHKALSPFDPTPLRGWTWWFSPLPLSWIFPSASVGAPTSPPPSPPGLSPSTPPPPRPSRLPTMLTSSPLPVLLGTSLAAMVLIPAALLLASPLFAIAVALRALAILVRVAAKDVVAWVLESTGAAEHIAGWGRRLGWWWPAEPAPHPSPNQPPNIGCDERALEEGATGRRAPLHGGRAKSEGGQRVPSTAQKARSSRSTSLKLAFKYLRPTDLPLLEICSRLLKPPQETDPAAAPADGIRIGRSENGLLEHHVLSLWTADQGPDRPVGGLVGFVEVRFPPRSCDIRTCKSSGSRRTETLSRSQQYFHAAIDPTTLMISKLTVAAHPPSSAPIPPPNAGERLVLELRRSPAVRTIEVWSLWHVEPFYKALGFVDVAGPRGHRVVAEWGPLLVWMREREGRGVPDDIAPALVETARG